MLKILIRNVRAMQCETIAEEWHSQSKPTTPQTPQDHSQLVCSDVEFEPSLKADGSLSAPDLWLKSARRSNPVGWSMHTTKKQPAQWASHSQPYSWWRTQSTTDTNLLGISVCYKDKCLSPLSVNSQQSTNDSTILQVHFNINTF